VTERIDALLTFDGSDSVSSLTMPTLVLGTRDDMIVPAFLQEKLAAAIPMAQKIMFDDGGHFFPVSRQPAFTRAVQNWLSSMS
jgi:pimeloyl-ACP methyl ester carboxylesterase